MESEKEALKAAAEAEDVQADAVAEGVEVEAEAKAAAELMVMEAAAVEAKASCPWRMRKGSERLGCMWDRAKTALTPTMENFAGEGNWRINSGNKLSVTPEKVVEKSSTYRHALVCACWKPGQLRQLPWVRLEPHHPRSYPLPPHPLPLNKAS